MLRFTIIILIFFSFGISQHFSGDIGLMVQFPQGEFKEEGVKPGFGLDINGMYHPVREIGFGLNLGGSMYDTSTRQIPFSVYTPLVTITEKTSYETLHGHVFFRIIPFQANIKPYFEGLVGIKNLSTSTELINNNCSDNDDDGNDDCIIASSKNSSDNALSYGFGSGLEVVLTRMEYEDGKQSGALSFFINGRYLWGQEATYLRGEDAIDIEDNVNSEGYITPPVANFLWSNTKTDLLQITVGVNFKFGNSKKKNKKKRKFKKNRFI